MESRPYLSWIFIAVIIAGFPAFAIYSANFADQKKQQQEEEREKIRQQVRFEWSIKFGVLNDDILLTNKSPFPLTHVILNIELVQGTLRVTRALTAYSIESQQTYKWGDVVSIPNSWLSDSKATLNCDQLK